MSSIHTKIVGEALSIRPHRLLVRCGILSEAKGIQKETEQNMAKLYKSLGTYDVQSVGAYGRN